MNVVEAGESEDVEPLSVLLICLYRSRWYSIKELIRGKYTLTPSNLFPLQDSHNLSPILGGDKTRISLTFHD